MARLKFVPGGESKEKRESLRKRREGLAVKCEQFRRLFGATISLTINVPSASGPGVDFAYFSNPDNTMGLNSPADQKHRSIILQPNSFEDVTDSEGSSTVDASILPRTKVKKIRIKRVIKRARLRKVPATDAEQGLTERQEVGAFGLSMSPAPVPSNIASLHCMKLLGFDVIDRLSRKSLSESFQPLSVRLPGINALLGFPSEYELRSVKAFHGGDQGRGCSPEIIGTVGPLKVACKYCATPTGSVGDTCFGVER